LKTEEIKGNQMNNIIKSFSLLVLLGLLTTSCIMSSRIGNGVTHNGSLATINSSIDIGNGSTVTGESRTVNGSITVGDNSDVGDLQTVNGGIRIGSNTSVHGSAGTINGPIRCKSGVQIDGTLSTINGPITLTETTVMKNLETINGNITLAQRSGIRGDIILRSRGEKNQSPKEPLIVKLSGSSVVEGNIINKDERYQVIVIFADDSKVLGEIKNAEIRR